MNVKINSLENNINLRMDSFDKKIEDLMNGQKNQI